MLEDWAASVYYQPRVQQLLGKA